MSVSPNGKSGQIDQLFQSIKSQRAGLHAQSILKEVRISAKGLGLNKRRWVKKAGEEGGPRADGSKWEWTKCGWMKQHMGKWKQEREAIRDEDFF